MISALFFFVIECKDIVSVKRKKFVEMDIHFSMKILKLCKVIKGIFCLKDWKSKIISFIFV